MYHLKKKVTTVNTPTSQNNKPKKLHTFLNTQETKQETKDTFENTQKKKVLVNASKIQNDKANTLLKFLNSKCPHSITGKMTWQCIYPNCSEIQQLTSTKAPTTK